MVPIGQDDPIAAMGAYWSAIRHPSHEGLDVLFAIANACSLAFAKIDPVREPDELSGIRSD